MVKTSMNNQQRRPLFDAMVEYAQSDAHPFDVPGHKMGKGIHPDFKQLAGDFIFKLDVNSMPNLDNLSNPEGVIREAEDLAADYFGVDNVFFLVNGSTSGIQNMIMSVMKPGETIILPRNIHKSAVNGLILSGAKPVYVHPEIEPYMGISVGHSVVRTKQTIDQHPEAKAILLLNPTYYGYSSNIKEIIDYAHEKNIAVIVDESHGSHFYADSRFGQPSMKLGADMATISVHKTGGSFTQSSMLLHNEGFLPRAKVQSTINIMQTSSASYLLMGSLDMARHQLATNPKIIENVYELSMYVRKKMKKIRGLRIPPMKTTINKETFTHDPSKLLIDIHRLGLSGNDIADILKQEFNITVEVGESRIILAIISVGDTKEEMDYFIHAFEQIANRYYTENPTKIPYRKYFRPVAVKTPREAYFSETEYVSISQAKGRISGDQIMIYPPGIPLLVPGEKISADIMKEYERLIQQGNKVIGSVQNGTIKIKVLKEAK